MVNKAFSTKNGVLYNNDILEMEDELPNNIDLVITSPPYNIGIKYDVYNDNLAQDDYYDFIKKVFTLLYKKLNSSGRAAINILYEANTKKINGGGRIFIASDYWNILKGIGYKWAGLVDLKENPPHRSKNTAWGSWLSPSAPYIYNPKECILIVYKDSWKKARKGVSYFTKDKKEEFYECVSGEWKYKAETKKHTNANFSLDIPEKALKILSWEDDLVIDPFMGSGTTAIACEKMNRRWIGTEISENYCSVSINRIKEVRG